MGDDAEITYERIKTALANKFTGVEFKRKLETKLRGLGFMKGADINLFSHELRTFYMH